MITPEQILQRAKVEILERGWCQGVSEDEEGHVCLLGAMAKAYDYLPPGAPYALANRRVQDRIQEKGYDFISAWNDAPERTQEDIIQLLEEIS